VRQDYLTGFYNRFYLSELTEDMLNKENIGVTYIDINGLKTTNDTKGHAAGDDLIVRMSDILRVNYKDSLIFRVGGDEFVVITQGETREEFMRLSENVKKNFEESNIAAIGYEFYDKIVDLTDSINRCDHMMYEHKAHMKEKRC
jgi:diguanylate cyclase (GGDEF)-like protein